MGRGAPACAPAARSQDSNHHFVARHEFPSNPRPPRRIFRALITMYTPTRLMAGLLPLSVALCLGLPGTSGGQPIDVPAGVAGRVVVRSGDPAPGTARFGDRFDSLATAPDGPVFIDGAGSALFLESGDEVRVLAYTGQRTAGGRILASLASVAAGGDGTIAFQATLSDGREGIFRIDPERGAPEEVILTQDTLELRDGPATVWFLYAPVVDGEGAVVLSIVFSEVPGAVLRFPRAAAPQIVLQTGDPVGPGIFQAPLARPAVSPAGLIALTATLETGEDVVVRVASGAAPLVLALFPLATGPLSPFLTLIPPAINDALDVAFLLVESGNLRLRLVTRGTSIPLAGPGTPAPGGGTFREISEFPPALDPAGNVMFGAVRSNGRHGFYLAGGATVALAEEGQPAGPAGTLQRVETKPLSGAAASLGAGGTFHCAATASAASGIFLRDAGTLVVEVASGDPIPEARFVSFLDGRGAPGGGGPSLAPGGWMIFDARVTGGSRGLFACDRFGTIRSVAHDGDAAPGGGRFVGDRFAFHSINDDGIFAFLGQAVDPGASPAISLFYGSLGDGSMRRVVDTEMLPTGIVPPGSFRRVKAAPSRVNRSGQIAVPLAQADNTSMLMGYDGRELFRIAGPGDQAPGGDTFATAFTGSLFTGQPVPPALDDDGRVRFGAQTTFGDSALYAAPLTAGGGVPARVIGLGDEVEGGRLSFFELQALDADTAGRIAFQSIYIDAIYSDEFEFADFVTDGGPVLRLAARHDHLFEGGDIFQVLPLLALLGEGRVGYGVHLFDGSEMILAARPGSGEGPEVLAATGVPSPDGGVYVSFRSGLLSPGRLASDGRGSIALAAVTTAGPEAIVLFGKTNASPTASAGPDLVVECAGPGGTEVTLDGTGSSDPDDDVLSYHWTGPFGEVTGPRPTVILPFGVSLITLVVDDGQTTGGPDTVRVEVRDTLPPSIAASAAPSVLWPPDGRLVDVGLTVQAADRCDPAPTVVLQDVTNSEPSAGRPGSSIAGASEGTNDHQVSLRAERSGSGPGRTYTLTYRATDRSGNFAAAAATVTVPHDRRP